MNDKKKSIGALWLRESKDGKKYMSGQLEIGERKLPLVIFKNGFKKSDKHPDYMIYKSEKVETKKETKSDDFEDDIPF